MNIYNVTLTGAMKGSSSTHAGVGRRKSLSGEPAIAIKDGFWVYFMPYGIRYFGISLTLVSIYKEMIYK